VQAAVRAGGEAPVLALVTRGAQPAGPAADVSAPAGAALWGLGRVIAVEQPALRGKCIDLGPKMAAEAAAAALLEELLQGDRAENQVALRSEGRYVPRLVRAEPKVQGVPVFRERGTYLITGGLGGLGLCVARWMVQRGARHLVLMGRSAPKPDAEQVLQELRGAGAEIVIARADVSRHDDVARALAEVPGAAPLRGIVHAAGVLDDEVLTQQDALRFARVLAPKVAGAWNLHLLTRTADLDFFVLFGSFAGLLPRAGQGCYAAGNAFLDGLAHLRRAAALPALSIDWGPWAKVGMAASLTEQHHEGWMAQGVGVIEPAQGIDALERMLAGGLTQVAVWPLDKARMQAVVGVLAQPFLSALVGTEQAEAERTNILEELRQADPDQRRELAIDLVRQAVRQAFGFNNTMRIPVDQNLTTLGMDSLIAVLLTNRLKNTLGQPIQPTFVFEHPTLESIADHVLTLLERSADEVAVATQSPLPVAASVNPNGGELNPIQAEQMLHNLDQLSDADVDAMLGTVLNEGSEGR
jgi:hypothetical protein